MVTMLDCIKRVPSRIEWVLENRADTFACLHGENERRLTAIDEIVMIGCGTSNTSALTARFIMEKASGLRVTVTLPTDFLYHSAFFNPNALYVFTSQTGTSAMTRLSIAKARKRGALTICISENAETPAAKEAELFVCMGCGVEEYGMRTIGFSTSVLTLGLLGVELGLINGHITHEEAQGYLTDAKNACAHIPQVIELSEKWMDADRRNLMRCDCLAFTGSGALAGVAMEASVKVWETPQTTAVYYELEEGLHAPNYGYNHRHCLLVLNDGGIEREKASAICRYMKFEMNNGFMIGADPVDEHDLAFTPEGGAFACLEFAAAVQVIAYRMAVAQGRDLVNRNHGNMDKYFVSHRPVAPEELA